MDFQNMQVRYSKDTQCNREEKSINGVKRSPYHTCILTSILSSPRFNGSPQIILTKRGRNIPYGYGESQPEA